MKLYIVGFGCGSREGMTIEAENILKSSDIIVGYTVYTDIVKQFFSSSILGSTSANLKPSVT